MNPSVNDRVSERVGEGVDLPLHRYGRTSSAVIVLLTYDDLKPSLSGGRRIRPITWTRAELGVGLKEHRSAETDCGERTEREDEVAVVTIRCVKGEQATLGCCSFWAWA